MNMSVPKLIQKVYKSFLMKEKIKLFLIIFFLSFSSSLYASQIQNIEVKGNERISNETIEMFSEVEIGQNINQIDLNKVLKNLYNSYFFENVSVEINNNNLIISVVESPMIENINVKGIKSNKMNNEIH